MRALNRNQLLAATSEEPVTVVVAGPGSGKSSTLIARVQHRVDQGVNPARICLLSFTNAAAHTLVRKLAAIDIQVGYAGTLHGWCFRILQEHGHLLGYRKGRAISLINADDSRTMLKAIMTRLKVKLSLSAIQTSMVQGQPEGDARLVWGQYAHELKRSNMIDYDGLLSNAHRLLENPDVLASIQFDEVMGDEMQDSGMADWLLINRMPGRKFLVGDPDQSIFGFRGGDPSLLIGAAGKSRKPFILDLNYRSDVNICYVSHRLISHNQSRVEKAIWPLSKEPGVVEVVRYEDDRAEVAGTIRRIMALGEDCAVLARTNALANSMKDGLLAAGIRVQRTGSPKMPSDWADALLLLNLSLNPYNDLLMEKWMRWEFEDADALKVKAAVDGCSLYEVSSFRPLKQLWDVPTALRDRVYSGETVAIIEQRIALLPQSEPTLADLVADLWRHEEWSQDALERGGVYCGTIHGFKGGEADNVFVIGMEEGVFPKIRKTDAEGVLEDERRLAFVAFTRARHQLFLSWCARRRDPYGKVSNEIQPSRFVKESGAGL